MTDARQPMRKTIRAYWWKEKRFAELACGHSEEISAKDALPPETACPSCPAEPLEPA